MHRHHPPRQPRRGFTLLEILIVVALIATLAAFLTVAIGRSLTQAREAATRATLLKVDGMLQQRLEAFRMLMDSPQKQNEIKGRMAAKKQEMLAAGVNRSVSEKFLTLTIYKDYYRNGFPQTLADNPSLGTTGQPFAVNNLPGPTQTQKQKAAESSEMLYWSLTSADTFGVPAVDDSEFSSSEIADTDGDGLLELVDAWGQPLRFYRWPTRLIRPGGPATAIIRPLAGLLIKGLPAAPTASGDVDQLSLDPDDQVGVYLATVNNSNLDPALYESHYHTPDTYHIPLIVSAGPDKATGLNEPYNDPATTSDDAFQLALPTAASMLDFLNSELNDNLTNRQKQQK